MAWDVGYMGSCSRCGEHVHQFEEDRPGMSALWLRCPQCLKADVQSVAAAEAAGQANELHPCPRCGTERELWQPSKCPRCGQDGAGEFIYMPD